MRQAVSKLQALLPIAPSPVDRAALQRDLMEVCAVGYDFRCVKETIGALLVTMRSDKRFSILYPEVIVYETKLMQWEGNDDYIKQILQSGGPFKYVDPDLTPAATAELQLAIHAIT